MTSLKRRLDCVLDQLALLDTETDEETSSNIAAQISIIQGAFRESENCPICCFRYNTQRQVLCDCQGPLTIKEFMKKCRDCQAQIKETLVMLQIA